MTLRSLIIGDSLPVPRPHRGQHMNSTWPMLMKKEFEEIDIWQRCRAGNMSNDVLKEFGMFSDSLDCFQSLIVQVGIGDCCPRPYPLTIHKFLLTYEFAKLLKFINSYYPPLLKIRSKPWISPQEFESNIRFITDTTKKRNPSTSVVLIAVGPPCNDMVVKAPGVAEMAVQYNQILRSISESYSKDGGVSFIDPYVGLVPEPLFLADGHHLTVEGHQVVAKAMRPHFEALRASSSTGA